MTPLIIAHRGASAHAPENTIAAFSAAFHAGADGVEFDVQLSKDGVPIVFHDHDLRRIAGRRDLLRDLTADELADIDVGAWFDKRRKTHEFAGEGIPTLTAVLEFLQDFRGKLYVELKSDRTDSREMARAVCDFLRPFPHLEQVVVKSFYLDTLVEMKGLIPEIQTAALFAPQLRKRNYIDLARKAAVDQLSLHYSLATSRRCAAANDAGLPITIWTVDNARWIERCEKRGIGALITNDPARMLVARD